MVLETLGSFWMCLVFCVLEVLGVLGDLCRFESVLGGLCFLIVFISAYRFC